MELGTQIKTLRQARGITQETLAEKLGVSAQAVSKWERNTTVPDVQLLPEISTYFGVTIDDLFALSDEKRIERIENMLWNERELNPETVAREETFLLDRAMREPEDYEPYELLAQIYNHKAQENHRRAMEFAKASLERDPNKGPYNMLVEAMGGRCDDWCEENHYQLIDWLETFLADHMDSWQGILWLLAQLIDAQRFDEARTWCDRLAQVDHTYRTPLYRGMICWYEGDREGAMRIWEQVQRDFPDDWHVVCSMGDMMARAGRYREAIDYYRLSMEVQKKRPRMADGIWSIAQVCEIIGDIPGAIAAREEMIRILDEEYQTTTGESVDRERREIARLKAKL